MAPGMGGSITGEATSRALEDSAPKEESKQPRIRYRIEYRNPDTDELIHQRDADHPDSDTLKAHDLESPVLELVTTYRSRLIHSNREKSRGPTAVPPPSTALSTPSIRMNIYSGTIINALQSVVQYYPSQDLVGDFITIDWPYPVLVHHYGELAAFREACAAKNPSDMCVREKDADEHLGLLLKFLDDEIMPAVYAEQERNAKGFYTFEYYWVSQKPGRTLIDTIDQDNDWHRRVIQSVSGGIFDSPPSHWQTKFWNMRFNGRYLGRESGTLNTHKFDGERAMQTRRIVIDDYNPSEEKLLSLGEVVKKQYEYGKKYWDLLHKQCRYYKGKSREFPFNEVDGLVMSDPKSYYVEIDWDEKPALMDRSDCRNWVSDCACTVCKERKTGPRKQMKSVFDSYNGITLESWHRLTPHQYLLCPVEIKAFIFATRQWEKLHVENFLQPMFEEDMINSLVMDSQRKATIKALAKSFARQNKHNDQLSRDMWSADFIKGKGSGLIFLLHGQPGVGKTCTAECIAAFTKRPLMVLTSSDIGTDPSTVEANLTKNFKTATSWGAVLLIDEADVFMERRTSSDLTRNSLVAGFLRALEYYSGILFLTTNRVGSFDDAFISRVHIQMYYPDFSDEERQQVWHTFIDKLARERGDYIRLNIDAKEYIRSSQVRAVKWNGREIRNAFQTAVALAEYDSKKDEEGRILLTDTHFRPLIEISQDFKDYLEKLHRANESKRAERRYDRLDTFSKESTSK